MTSNLSHPISCSNHLVLDFHQSSFQRCLATRFYGRPQLPRLRRPSILSVLPLTLGEDPCLRAKVVCKEIVKPASPTPSHLRSFKLSLIDQYAAPIYMPLILFYSASDDKVIQSGDDKRCDRLKKSLSEILTHFYQLGGRINDNRFINCNDEGINFFEARINGQLSHLLSHFPSQEELADLLLPKDNFYGMGPKALLSIQVNLFDCGGMAVGVCMSHKACDASALGLFINNWAAITREDNELLHTKLGAMTSTLFPSKDEPPFVPDVGNQAQNLVCKRFVFDALNIAALKAKCSNNNLQHQPTRVEAVSALIWRCGMNVVRMRTKSVKAFVAIHAVNLRERMVPPLSNPFVLGNLNIGTMATSTTSESPPELHSLVARLRKAIKKVDGDFVRKLQVDDGLSTYYSSTGEMMEKHVKGELQLFLFTSWCRFPFYEADFGWGKPIQITPVHLILNNTVILVDTKCGKGIEAWVSLDKKDMARFQCEPELTAFTSTSQG